MFKTFKKVHGIEKVHGLKKTMNTIFLVDSKKYCEFKKVS